MVRIRSDYSHLMLIPARKLAGYISTTTFPLPVWSEDGFKDAGYVESSEELLRLACAGLIVGRGTAHRLKSVQLNTLTPTSQYRVEGLVEYRESREKGDRNSIYRDGFTPIMKREGRDGNGVRTGALVRW